MDEPECTNESQEGPQAIEQSRGAVVGRNRSVFGEHGRIARVARFGESIRDSREGHGEFATFKQRCEKPGGST